MLELDFVFEVKSQARYLPIPRKSPRTFQNVSQVDSNELIMILKSTKSGSIVINKREEEAPGLGSGLKIEAVTFNG